MADDDDKRINGECPDRSGPAGWIVPVEPLLAPLRERPECQAILNKLAARAR